MAVTIYTASLNPSTGDFWTTSLPSSSDPIKIAVSTNSLLWMKITDPDSTTLMTAPQVFAMSTQYYTVGTVTTKVASNTQWIGTVELRAKDTVSTYTAPIQPQVGSKPYIYVKVVADANGWYYQPAFLSGSREYKAAAYQVVGSAGTPTNGTAYWARSNSSIIPPETGWSTGPEVYATDASDYCYWYCIVPAGSTYSHVLTTHFTTFSITQAPLTATASSHVVMYGANIPTLSITYSGWKGSDDISSLYSVPTVTTTYTSSSSVSGSPYPVTFNHSGGGQNYLLSYVDGSITVMKAASTLSLYTSALSYGTTFSYDVSNVVQSHDGTLSYAITTNGTTTPSTINGSTVTFGAMSPDNDTAQTVIVTISDAGDVNHSNGFKTITFTVYKNNPTITWANSTTSVVYGGTLSVAATATSSMGTVGTLSYSLSSTDYMSISGSTVTGTAYSGSTTTTVTCTHNRTSTVQQATKTRTLTVTKASSRLTLISATATCPTKSTYDVSTNVAVHDGTCTYSITTNGTTTASTISGSVVSFGAMASGNDNNQTVVVTISDPGDANHNSGSKTMTFTVQKNTPTITWDNVIDNVTYGETLSVLAIASSTYGTVGTLSYSLSATTYFSISGSTITANAYSGSNTTTVTCTHARTTTVKQTTTARTVKCSKRPVTITATGKSRVYGESNPSFTSTITEGSLVNSGDLGTFGGSCSATATSNVGSYEIVPTYTTNTNYQVTSISGTLSVTKATLTCTGSSHSITYGDTKPTLSISYSGWKNSDTTSSLTTLPTVSTTYVAGSNKGSYNTVVSGGTATNYTFSYVNGIITVSAKTASLSWGTLTWTYDGQEHSTSCTVSNKYGSDTCIVTLTGNAITDYGTATVTASSLSNSNYTLPSSKTATLTINKRPVTITANDETRGYGESNPTFTATITSGSLVVSTDLGTISATCSATSSSPVGSYDIVPSYTANTNYQVTTVNGTLTIGSQVAILTLSKVSETKYTTQTIDISTYVTQHTGALTYSIKKIGRAHV